MKHVYEATFVGRVDRGGGVVGLVGVGEAVVCEAVSQAGVRTDADAKVIVVAGAEIKSMMVMNERISLYFLLVRS